MLTCQAKVVADALEIVATFTNQTGHPIWVAEALLVPSGASMRYDERAAYVTIEDDDRVVLSKKLMPAPSDRLIEAPELPRWKRIQPSEEFSTTLVAALPLTEFTPYPKGDSAKSVAKPREVACELGYLPSPDETPPRYSEDAVKSQSYARVPVDVAL